MKKILYAILLFAGACGAFASCSNGDYVANPNGTTGAVNPLDPLSASQFTWGGTSPLSATINGASFVADSAHTTWALDTAGGNIITGLNSTGTQGMSLYLKNVYAVNLYGMGYGSYNINASWIDSLGVTDSYYFSVLGNSGEVYITENDSAFLVGKFYFTGVSSNGNTVVVSNGYFHITKPH